MKNPLRVLIVEDVEDDARLVLLELRRGGYEVYSRRVDSADDMAAALDGETWDLILSDYSMPSFDAPSALRLLQSRQLDVPFIIVSATVGEDTAVAAMKAGAQDYLVKGHLKRLIPAVERELRDAAARAAKQKAEVTLRRVDERFRTLVNSIEDMVFTLDANQRIDGVFGRWLEREGLNADVVIGRTVADLFGGQVWLHGSAHARAFAGEHVTYEWSTSDGARHFNSSLSPMRDEGRVTGLVAIARDITEQKQVQTQLLLSDRMATVGTLAAGMAHEINNPLAAILANLDFALLEIRRMGPNNGEHGPLLATQLEEFEEPVRDAREAAEQVRQIVKDLRIFSRSDEEDRKGPLDIRRILESSLRMSWNQIRHRARLVKDYQAVLPVLGNESRLGQVFLNLIINAAQSIPEGRADKNEIRIITKMENDKVVVEVVDTGSGMSAQVQKKLFTPFFTTKPVGVGSGLGLSICHRIVTSMGGTINATSKEDVGTTFRVVLPHADPETKARAISFPSIRPPRRGRILVIDDEPMVTKAVTRTLDRDHDVTAVTNAQEAMRHIQDGQNFDVILCDLIMPHMTGMDFYAELQRSAPNLVERTIFLTGDAFTPRARAFLDKTPNQRVEKPFDAMHLSSLINDRLRVHRMD